MANAVRDEAVALSRLGRRPTLLSATIGVAVLHASIALPALYNAIFAPERWTGPQDFPAHTAAVGLTFPTWYEPVVPHFLTHLAVRLVAALTGLGDFRHGMLVVSVASCALFGVVLFRYFLPLIPRSRSSFSLAALVSVFVAFAESPSILLGWSYQWPPDFFLPLNMPHTPTTMVGRAPSVLAFLVVVACLREPMSSQRRWLVPLVILSTLAKPALMPPLVATALLVSVVGRKGPLGGERLKLVLWRLVLPLAVLASLQWLIMEFQSPDAYGGRAMVIAPFRDLAMMGGDKIAFWTVLLLPAVALAMFGRRLVSDELLVGLSCLLLSLASAVLFGLDGGIPFSADFIHFLQASVLVLMVAVVGQLLRLAGGTRLPGDASRLLVICVVAAPYVIGGLAHWTCQGGGPCLVA